MIRVLNGIKQGFNSKPWYLIFFITSKCNLRCQMCFYWERIQDNKIHNELCLNEIKKIAPQFDNLFQLTITGGEALLRSDCIDIVSAFSKSTPVKRITLTTNGTFPEKIAIFVEKFCSAYPQINLSVNLSLDGLESTHDKIRGLQGAFKKLLESFDLLGKLMKKYKNLRRSTATTVSTLNVNEIFDLLNFIEGRMDISTHGLMFVRSCLKDQKIKDFSYERFQDLVFLLENKSKSRRGRIANAILNTYQSRRLNSMKNNVMRDLCFAGKKLIILDEKGNMYPCELLEPIRKRNELDLPFEGSFNLGNIRESDYNIKEILGSSKTRRIIKFIQNNGCHCSFECAMINNFVLNPFNYARIIANILGGNKYVYFNRPK